MKNILPSICAVAAVGVAAVALPISSAQAAESDDCREVVRATASVDGTSVVAKVRAREKAIGEWREKVSASYGASFRTWLKSHDRTVNCEVGADKTSCTVEGFPCKKF
jgi:hypothetical protein